MSGTEDHQLPSAMADALAPFRAMAQAILGPTQPTPEQAAQVLFAYGAGGYRAGRFMEALIDVMGRADPENLGRLALSFPGYATAVHLARNDLDGIAKLREIAGKLAGPERIDGGAG